MLSKEIAQYLQRLGVGIYDENGVTGDIFIETLPNSPDEAMAIYSYQGPGSDGTPHGYINIQIITRGIQNPEPAYERATRASKALKMFHGKQLITNGVHVVLCKPIQDYPYHLGRDENGRHEYTQNFTFMVADQPQN